MIVARVTLLTVALVFGVLLPSGGQAPPPAARALDRSDLMMQGVRTMMVTVFIDGAASRYVDAARLKADIEAGLRAANITVVPKADSLFNFNIVSFQYGGLVYYAADAGFYRVGQVTALRPDPALTPSIVRVWERDLLFGNVGSSNAQAGIMGLAAESLQAFLTQWSAANAGFRGTTVVNSTQPLPSDSDGLRGARSLTVMTEVAPNTMNRMRESQLTSIVERRLRGAGLTVDSNSPNILIAALFSQNTSQGILFLVTLNLLRPVIGIQRNGSSAAMLGVVWHTTQLAAFARFPADPADDVGLAVEEFLAAYRKANPSATAPATTSAPTATPAVYSVESLTDACIDSWRSTVLPRRLGNTQAIMVEGQTWCRCLAPYLFSTALPEEDRNALLRDFVTESNRIRNASTDERLKTACFNR